MESVYLQTSNTFFGALIAQKTEERPADKFFKENTPKSGFGLSSATNILRKKCNMSHLEHKYVYTVRRSTIKYAQITVFETNFYPL